MENNRTYLQRFPLVFLIVFAGIIIQVLFLDKMFDPKEDTRNLYIFLNRMIWDGTFFIAVGIALQRLKHAVIAVVLIGAINGLQLFVFRSGNIVDDQSAATKYIIGELLSLLPFYVFFFGIKMSGKKIVYIILAVIAFRGISGVYSLARNMDQVGRFFSMELGDLRKVISLMLSGCATIFNVLLFCELKYFAEKENISWQPKLLNPGNRYEKLSATLVFYVLKIVLVSLAAGYIFHFRAVTFFSGTSGPIFTFFYYETLLNTCFAVLLMVFCAWYLRKFLLEFLISYDIPSRFTYWLLMLPGIGFIAWLFCLQKQPSQTFNAKVSSINNFAASPSQPVTVIIVILMCLQALFLVTNGATAVSIISVFANMLFFAWMINQRSGYYFNLYLTLTVLLLLTLFIFFFAEKREIQLLSVLFSILLFNVAQLILIYPVYHFEDFSYIDNSGEAPAAGNEDKLTEFEQ